MLRGYKGYIDGVLVIKVAGGPRRMYYGYPAAEAERSYRAAQERARDEALAFCESFAEGRSWSYGEIAGRQAYFEQQGRRYGLLREFRENDIC